MKIRGRRILFVEDDNRLTGELFEHFSIANLAVFVRTVEDARKYLRFLHFDAVVLDVVLGEENGLRLLESLPNLPPVLVYSVLDTEYDILRALELGAVDYVVKPCSMALLEAKLKLRLSPARFGVLTSDGLSLNPTQKSATYYDASLHLTSIEFDILYFLMQNTGEIFPAEQLYEQLWQEQSLNNTTVRKHISGIKAKLTEICPQREFVRNEFGKGYHFVGEVHSE